MVSPGSMARDMMPRMLLASALRSPLRTWTEQGKESVSQYLAEHPELMDEITQDVLRTVVPGFELPEEKKDLVSDTVEGTGIPNESSEESLLELELEDEEA